jgi:hypothetical protein
MSERECALRERGLGSRRERDAFSSGPATRAGRPALARANLPEERT